MVILLMAAGAGKRMQSADVPKPFVEVNGKPMWQHTAEKMGLKNRGETVHLVMQEHHRQFMDIDNDQHCEVAAEYVDDIQYITDMTEKGPAWSVVAATLSLHGSHSILIVDSDCWVEVPEDAPSFMRQHAALLGSTEIEQIAHVRANLETDTLLFGVRVFEDTADAAQIDYGIPGDGKSYPRIVEGGVAKGGLLNVGAYWFKSLDDFRSRVALCTKQAEVKISDVVNAHNYNTEVVSLNGVFRNIGTKERLAAYLEETNAKQATGTV